jgi:hypothetical protein
MIIKTTGIYALLTPDRTFEKWVKLEAGSEIVDGYYLPQIISDRPTFDPDVEKLDEGTPVIDLEAQTATKTWVVVALDLDSVGNPTAFLADYFDTANANRDRIGRLLMDQIDVKPSLGFSLFGVSKAGLGSSSVFKLRTPANDNGFYFALAALATAASLNDQDRTTVNASLKKYNLRRVL